MVSSGVTGGMLYHSKLYQLYFLEIKGIPYMEKVTEFREIPRNFTELYDTEFGGIPPEF
jgi:hypothetical protein